MNASISPRPRSRIDSSDGCVTQVMSLRGTADVGCHAGNERRAGEYRGPRSADGLPFQVADRPDPLGAEQLKAADVDPS